MSWLKQYLNVFEKCINLIPYTKKMLCSLLKSTYRKNVVQFAQVNIQIKNVVQFAQVNIQIKNVVQFAQVNIQIKMLCSLLKSKYR